MGELKKVPILPELNLLSILFRGIFSMVRVLLPPLRIKVKYSSYKYKDYVQRGSLDYGEYSKMSVQYGQNDFAGCQTVNYRAFDDDGAYNELKEDKTSIIVLCCFGAGLLIIAEVYIIDCYVSYGRGRGFLTGHGYHVHTYGRSNPYYIRARDKYNAQHASRSGGRSGGCACACACACAGGGRAGCSQKDTFGMARGWRKKNYTQEN